jgi:hypothetical protein
MPFLRRVDFPLMNMRNRSTQASNTGGRVSSQTPVDIGGQTSASRQQVWERANRLYAIGELNLAARLLSELAAGRRSCQAKTLEASHG